MSALLLLVLALPSVALAGYDYLSDLMPVEEWRDVEAAGARYGLTEADRAAAIRQYSFTPQELRQAVAAGTLASPPQNGEDTVWLPPFAKQGVVPRCLMFYRNDSGQMTMTEVAPAPTERTAYAFAPALVEQALQGAAMPEPDVLYLVTLSQCYTDLLVAGQGETLRVIPFSAWTDILEIENGRAYTPQEFAAKLDALEKPSRPARGLLALPLLVLLPAALLYCRKRRGTGR